ncbi:MAG: tRNA (adenosine(37)-N6)-threonylcarbamoyltransferase complex dimerization subunit type 1 TsaB [Myxococcales bacterium]
MLVLALDTSTFLGTVAVLRDGSLLAELSASVRASHGETLLPHVERVLTHAGVKLAELDLLAVGIGPGSFTGVRIGVATAKGLALAEQKPLVGVTSLRTLARGMGHGVGLAVPVLDAHKGEVYCAAYARDEHADLVEVVAPFHALPADAAQYLRAAVPEERLWLAGDGLDRYGDALLAPLGKLVQRSPRFCDVPRAACLAHEAALLFERAGAPELATLEPLYLRPSDAKLPGGLPLVPME